MNTADKLQAGRRRPVARKVPLEDGEHSIERVNPRTVRVNGQAQRWLDWSIRVPGEAEPRSKRTKGPGNISDGDLRRRAQKTAAKLLSSGGVAREWHRGSSLGDFMLREVQPLLEAPNLAQNTKTRYKTSLKLLLGDCREHQHVHGLARKTIEAGTKFVALENCLREVAALHGAESARQCRTVLSGYVLRALLRRELIAANPIKNEEIDLKTGARVREGGRQGKIALTKAEYARVIDFLLELDPGEGVVAPVRGRWTRETMIAKRKQLIRMTLLQAATGMRMNEARQVWQGLLHEDNNNRLAVDVVGAIAKNAKPRIAYVLHDGVAERLRELYLPVNDPQLPLISAPADSAKFWGRRNCTRDLTAFYLEMAERLGIAAFKTERTHIWRTTLNTLLLGVVPDAVRSAQLGHTVEVNANWYTDVRMSDEMVSTSIETLMK